MPLRFVKFQAVNNLSIFIGGNFGGDDQTVISPRSKPYNPYTEGYPIPFTTQFMGSLPLNGHALTVR